ncbi:Neuroligin-4, Y-linked, partial [Stegodyphus mimosarum]
MKMYILLCNLMVLLVLSVNRLARTETHSEALPNTPLSGTNKPRTRVVSTKYGDLRGFVTYLPNLQSVDVFLGIPYASPPISALRFMPPVTPSHWKGVRSADKFSPVCPQKPPDIRNETEALKRMPP